MIGTLAHAARVDAQDRELGESHDFRVRVQAALRLGRIGGPQAKADLERGLRDPHPAVRVACAVSLGNVGDTASAVLIEQAMKSETFASAKTTMGEVVQKIKSRSGGGSGGGGGEAGLASAKYVVQLGAMRNNSGVRASDLDGVMRQAAKSKAGGIKGAVVLDGSDTTLIKKANDSRIPILLVDGNLTRLTQVTGRDGGLIVSAQVDMSVRRVPSQTLKGTVKGNASAIDDSRAANRAITELQNRAVGGAVESAMGSVGNEIAALAK